MLPVPVLVLASHSCIPANKNLYTSKKYITNTVRQDGHGNIEISFRHVGELWLFVEARRSTCDGTEGTVDHEYETGAGARLPSRHLSF